MVFIPVTFSCCFHLCMGSVGKSVSKMRGVCVLIASQWQQIVIDFNL